MQRVISELFGQYTGRPILVIGGGPSVTADLEQLAGFQPALTLSANDHGCMQERFAIDYIVHCDKIHCFRHVNMAEYLRQFGKPLMSRWASADMRLEDWTFTGNSGTTAVAVAAALGGSPIVVTGLDFWATATATTRNRNYFHDNAAGLTPAQQRLYAKPILSNPDRRLNRLAQFAGAAHIRPMSGLLLTRWPKYDPAEKLGAPPVLPYSTRDRSTALYRALRKFHWGNHDTVMPESVIKLTKAEAADLLIAGKVARIEPAG